MPHGVVISSFKCKLLWGWLSSNGFLSQIVLWLWFMPFQKDTCSFVTFSACYSCVTTLDITFGDVTVGLLWSILLQRMRTKGFLQKSSKSVRSFLPNFTIQSRSILTILGIKSEFMCCTSILWSTSCSSMLEFYFLGGEFNGSRISQASWKSKGMSDCSK